MKAAVVYGPNDLRIEERPMPEIKAADEVLVKIRAVGVCGSDIHMLAGENPFAKFPRVMGHEMVGEVVEFGDAVKDLEPGDHIVIEPITYSGKSYAVRRGMPNVSEDLKVNGVHVDGGQQEYLVIKNIQAHKIRKDIPWTTAVLAEPYTIAGQSSTRGQVGAADRVFIHGAGPIGIALTRICKVKGATVMVSDVVDDKLEFAKASGADVVVNPAKEDLVEAVYEWTGGEMANIVIDAACLPQTFQKSFDLVSVAGTIVVLGMDGTPVPIAQKPFMAKQLTVVGSRLQAFQFDPIIRLLEEGVIGDDGLVTHVIPFEKVQEGIDLMHEHPEQVKKLVLTFED
ncbi:alcohol dehydrogenase catalytic domain-containing protein [Bifidobacterium sp. SMB2]|uniref:Alcohol dehydrogenase catalytic domain-containing protein n=2 Tax=Bifidobacterium TaxID=1678 RepID=A0ABX0CF47_9BIFI|nr:alcohol dehydrogenase catalytic domain-containing protein [Bifidobacterium sp. SMB2]NEH11045.1 alcohol dehydrogenase catalytic domain-containing protein [Bifidobacterium saimiriisciurei]